MRLLKFVLQDLIGIMKGVILVGDESKKVINFEKDPNIPGPKALYFLFNENPNEEDLFAKLTKHKVSGLVKSHEQYLNLELWGNAGITVIEVRDVKLAYLDIAAYYRKHLSIPFIQVIGSAGKTTTKEMIGEVLKAEMPVLVGYRNYNAPVGVALNIFRIRERHQAAIIEVGMDCRGMIDASSQIIQPQFGIVTNIQRAHLSQLQNLENIVLAKAEMLTHIPKDGTLIINGEDENSNKLPFHLCKCRVIRYGFSNKFDYWAQNIKTQGLFTSFEACNKDFKIECIINTIGKFNVANALIAVIIGNELGLSSEKIQAGLANFKPVGDRVEILQGIKGSILINDSFASNPDLLPLVLKDVLEAMKDKEVILILSGMEDYFDYNAELARDLHFKIGEQLANMKFKYLVAVGKFADEYLNGAIYAGIPAKKLSFYENLQLAEKMLVDLVKPEDVVYFKTAGLSNDDVLHILRILKEG